MATQALPQMASSQPPQVTNSEPVPLWLRRRALQQKQQQQQQQEQGRHSPLKGCPQIEGRRSYLTAYPRSGKSSRSCPTSPLPTPGSRLPPSPPPLQQPGCIWVDPNELIIDLTKISGHRHPATHGPKSQCQRVQRGHEPTTVSEAVWRAARRLYLECKRQPRAERSRRIQALALKAAEKGQRTSSSSPGPTP